MFVQSFAVRSVILLHIFTVLLKTSTLYKLDLLCWMHVFIDDGMSALFCFCFIVAQHNLVHIQSNGHRVFQVYSTFQKF